MNNKVKAAIIGPGNIGLDLMFKLMRSDYIEVDSVVSANPNSKGLKIVRKNGITAIDKGVEGIIGNKDIKIVFDATSARAHQAHAPLLADDNKIAIDLTPAAVGPYVIPAVNINQHLDETNINMVTCGGQATTPIVAAINEVADVEYAEIVATIASLSAGPGTRASIDEFTETTARGLVEVGGADRGKAIIILNPAEPPLIMRDTVYTQVKNLDKEAITLAVEKMVAKVKKYVPGYTLKVPPIFDGNKVTVMLEIEGAGDYLPKYSGNLDIMTSAAKAVGEEVAMRMLRK